MSDCCGSKVRPWELPEVEEVSPCVADELAAEGGLGSAYWAETESHCFLSGLRGMVH